MPAEWFKLKVDSPAVKALKSALGSLDDPTTIILDNEGKIINEEASRTIYENKANGFPWSTAALEAAEKVKKEKEE